MRLLCSTPDQNRQRADRNAVTERSRFVIGVLALVKAKRHTDLSALARLAPDLEGSMFELASLSHADQSQVAVLGQPGFDLADVETDPVVPDVGMDSLAGQVQPDLDHLRLGVLVGVCEGLLDDPEEGALDIPGQSPLLS